MIQSGACQMHEEIGSYDAKTKLPELLRRVEAGETFTITNRGRAIADLIPSKSSSREKAKQAIDNLLKMSKRTVSDDVLKSLKESGRK
jgi:prevent-host-death family protein